MIFFLLFMLEGVYANFIATRIKSLKYGMSMKQVIEITGEPNKIIKREDGSTLLTYAVITEEVGYVLISSEDTASENVAFFYGF
jgi:hypothetical protein